MWAKETWDYGNDDKWRREESWYGSGVEPWSSNRWQSNTCSAEEAPRQKKEHRAQEAESWADYYPWSSAPWQYACSAENVVKEKNDWQEDEAGVNKERCWYYDKRHSRWHPASETSSCSLALGEPQGSTDSMFGDFPDDEEHKEHMVDKFRKYMEIIMASDIKRQPRQQCPNGHGPCNVSHRGIEKAKAYHHGSNITIVETDSQLWSMCSHLQGTVLEYKENLVCALYNLLTFVLDRYEVQYCGAQANRYLLVKCLACGCGMYGRHARKEHEDQQKTIRVLAAFVNRKLEASAAHPHLTRILRSP